MNSEVLIELALGEINPWYVDRVEFEQGEEGKELHIYLGLNRGSLFDGKKAHDYQDRTWRHLNFFEYRCYLHARVPRVKQEDGSVKMYSVPWSRRNLGFTLKFEAWIMLFLQSDLPVNGVAKLIGEHPNKVWDVFNYWLEKSYSAEDHSEVETLILDETSTKKGHNYMTVATDADRKRVVRCELGKDAQAVTKIKEYLESKGCHHKKIQHVCMDMSAAYISGSMKEFPSAQITFDRFHVMQIVHKAMDQVRKLERRESDLLKGHKYTVLKNTNKLSLKAKEQLQDLLTLFPTLGKAYRLKELIRQFWRFEDEGQAKIFLYEWLKECDESGIEPFRKAAQTISKHWTGVTNFTLSRLTSGLAESINRKIQTVKRLARGFRNPQNFINMVYYKCGKLSLQFPHF